LKADISKLKHCSTTSFKDMIAKLEQENGNVAPRPSLAMLVMISSPALACGDEIDPVPAQAVVGHAYAAENTPSQIRFINVRSRAVRILWVAFDGSERPYVELLEGQEIIQPMPGRDAPRRLHLNSCGKTEQRDSTDRAHPLKLATSMSALGGKRTFGARAKSVVIPVFSALTCANCLGWVTFLLRWLACANWRQGAVAWPPV
jgi:hypothetical protein